MADDKAWVANQNGIALAGAGDSFVYFLSDEQERTLESLIEDGDDEGVTYLEESLVRNIAVSRLIDIATKAVAVLDSEFGVKSASELAAALVAAGFYDVDDRYPVIVEAGA